MKIKLYSVGIFLGMMMLLFRGQLCKAAEVAEAQEQDSETQVEKKQHDIEWNWENIEISGVNKDMLGGSLSNGMSGVEYPYLRQGTEYSQAIAKVNRLLEQDVLEKHVSSIGCIIKYKITYLDEDYISVLYQGCSGWRLENMGWGITIDMRTGEQVSIEDILTPSERKELKGKLENKEFEEVRTIDDMYKYPSLYDRYFGPNEEYGNHYYNFYLKKDKIGLMFSEIRIDFSYSIIEVDRPGAEALEVQPQGQEDEEVEPIDVYYREKWNWKNIKIGGLNEELLKRVVTIEQEIHSPDAYSSNYDWVWDMLEEDAEQRCSRASTSYHVEWELTHLDEKYISILYQGTMQHGDASHPIDIAWGTTIDLEKQSMVSVDDVIERNILRERLEQKNFQQVRGYDLGKYERETPQNYRVENWYEQYEGYVLQEADHYHDFYLNQNRLGILLETGSHALGDYIIVELDSQKGLSDWGGKYTYIGEYRKYVVEIKNFSWGKGEADITIYVAGREESTKLKAGISGSHDRIDFIFQECLSGEARWDISGSDVVLFSFLKDAGDDIYTYWGELNGNSNYIGEDDGKICFVKEQEGQSEKIEEQGEQYTLKMTEEGYELTLYTKDNEKVDSEIYPITGNPPYRKPSIREITKDILQISYSVGSPACYTHFFDKEAAEISHVYFNPIIIRNQYVAYMEEAGVLIISDLFGRGEVYMEIERDFTPCANPIGAITNIELLDDKRIKIEYYEGDFRIEDFEPTITTEEIILE